jgi:hypothetical protein
MTKDVSPRYAVLFKTHFWDDFVARRFSALQARCPGGDLWLVVDQTHGMVDNIPHANVFRTTDHDMYALGLPQQAGISLNMYNVDYQLLAFYQEHAEYAFYIMVEYDAVVQVDLDELAADALLRGTDLIAFQIPDPVEKWRWTNTLVGVWRIDEIRNQLLCISGFSRRAVIYLLKLRLEHSARYVRGELFCWPFGEGFIPTALHTAGFHLESLTSFGSTECYDWWPPYHESELPNLATQAFVHPVLTGQRYVLSVLRYSRDTETLIKIPGFSLRRKLCREAPHIVILALINALRRKFLKALRPRRGRSGARRTGGLASLPPGSEIRQSGDNAVDLP